MNMEKDNDILGIRPFGEALNTTINKSFQAVEVFLAATCKPALEELGNMLKDKVRLWRLNHILKVIEKSKGKIEFSDNNLQLKANPKVALSIIDNCADEENEEIQDMWAGLFATSFSKDGYDDSGLTYSLLLKQLTIAEAKILKYMCENSKKFLLKNGLPIAQTISVNEIQLADICGIGDITVQESILNHLNSLRLNEIKMGMSSWGFKKDSDERLIAHLTPTTLALLLYLKCIGYRGSIQEYWNVKQV